MRASLLAAALLVPLAYAPLRLQELEQLKLFYNTTSGIEWSDNTNWDAGANSQCKEWAMQTLPPGWPYVAPEADVPLGPECIYKDPCGWDSKWHGVGCIDPCYAPTDGDNCVFGRVTYLNLVGAAACPYPPPRTPQPCTVLSLCAHSRHQGTRMVAQ